MTDTPNCTDYFDKDCLKGLTITKDTVVADKLIFLMVGCWGVYCWDGSVDMEEYNPDKNHHPIIQYKEEYGSGRVVKGLVDYTNKNPTQALFLAGDNVYSYNKLKPDLQKMINNKIFPTKKEYKTDYHLSGQDIDKQIQQGFKNCYNKVKVKDFFIALGNHDIQTCYDLNQQLLLSLYEQEYRYRLPAMYYNVVYTYNNQRINFIVLNTNIFENDPVGCGGKKYSRDLQEKLLKSHIKWVIKSLIKNNCEWNIIIGHIPYKCNPHKEKGNNGYIVNDQLDVLFKKIKNTSNCPKVQVYFCADEHNKQYLYDEEHKLSLIVAGTGGTTLDKILIYGLYFSDESSVKTYYYDNQFGFVSFTFEDYLTINYFVSRNDESVNSYEVKLNVNGEIESKGLVK